MCDMSETTRPVYDDADVVMDVPLTPGALGDIRKNLALDFTHQPPKETKPDILPGQEHMKVYLRVRPFMEHELENNENQNTIHQDTEHTLTVHAPKDSVTFKNTAHGCGKQTHNFTFSKIFNDNVQQKTFFEETMLGTVKEFVDGQNCLVFTYGVTGSGKTYTILGKPNDSGILPRSLDVVFNSIEGKQWASMSLKPHMFCDVNALSENQQDIEQKMKDKVFRLSTEDDVDMMTMMGDDMSDASRSTVNMTTSSLPSLTQTADSLTVPGDNTQVQMEQLFEEAKHRDREEAAIDVEAQGQIRFSIWVSFAEIYNEYMYDLLDPIPKKKTARRAVLKLASDKTGAPYIKGLKWIHVTTADEAYKVLTIGQRNLQTACTKLNQNSSRSHCIFTMKLLRVVDKENPRVARVSMLSFCDLAGSERYSKTQSTGERLREAGSINRSLLTLGQCIETLRFNQSHKTNQRIVPFRESKLTRLFQNFFSGKGRASMVVNINQNASVFDETLHVLKFSAIAKQVTSVQKEEKKPKRMVSLSMGPDGRASVAWATPGSMQRWIEEEENETLQTVEEEEESLYEEDAGNDQVNQKLMDIVEKLREQLKQDRMKMAMMELEIREEVCNEMASQLVRIEQDYSERMEEQRYQAEERADQKLKLYMASIKKSRKRARVDRFQDDDDEYVSTVILHQEKVKVQELEKEKKSLQEQLTKTRFELSAAKQQLEKGIMLERSAMLNDSSDITNNELMENLALQLEDSKSKLAEQEMQMMQLNDMLTEAGDMFEMKEIEIEKLKAVIHDDERRMESMNETMEDLKRVAVDSKQAIEEAEVKMKDHEETIRRLQAELSERDNQVSKLLEASVAKDEEINDLQRTIDALQQKCEDLRSQIEIETYDYEYATAKSLDSEVQVSETLRKYEAEKSRHAKSRMRIKELEARLEKPEGALSITIMETKREDLENELFLEREDRSQVEEKMRQMEQKISELESALAATRVPAGNGTEVDVIIDKLRGELNGAKGKIDMADSMITELSEKVKQLEGALEAAELELSMTRDEKSYSECKISDVALAESEERNVLVSRIKVLEEDLQASQNVCEKKVAIEVELNNLKTKSGLLEQELSQANIDKANLLTKLEMFEEDFEKCDERLTLKTKQNAELQASLDGLKAKLDAANEKFEREMNLKEEMERGFKKLKQCQEQTENKLLSMEDLLADDRKHEDEARSELEAANDRIARLEQEAAESSQQREEAALKMTVLQADLVKARSAMEGLCQLKKELEEVRAEADKVKGLKKKIKKMKEEVERVPAVEKDLEDAQARVAALQGEVDDAKADNATLRLATMQQVKLESDKVAGLQSEVDEIQIQTGKLADLEKELEDSAGEVVELEKELNTERDNVSRLERELKALQEEAGGLRNVREDLEKANETIEVLQKHLNDANEKVKCIKQELEEASSQSCKLMELESELEGFRTDTRKVERMEVQLGEIRVQAERSECLKEELRSVKEQNDKLKGLEGELDTARTQLQTFEKTKEELRSALSELMSMEDELERVQAELKDVKQELTLSVESAASLEQTVADVRKEKDAVLADAHKDFIGREELLKTQVGDLMSAVAALEREKDVLLIKVQAHVQTIEGLEASKVTLTQEVEEREGIIVELRTRITELESSLEETDEELSQQSMSKERAEEQRAQMEARLKKSQSRLEKAETTVVDVIKHREKAEENVEKLQEKVSVLTGECSELKRQLSEAMVLEQKVQDLEAEVENQKTQLSSEIGDKSTEVGCLQEKVKELEAAVNEQTILREELEANVKELTVLNGDFEQKVHALEASIEEQVTLKAAVMEKVTELEASVEEQRELKSEAMEKVTVLEASVEEQIVLKSEAMEKVTELEASVEEQKTLKSGAIEKVTESEASVEEQRALKSEAMEKVTELEASVEEQRELKSEAMEKVTVLEASVEEQIVLKFEAMEKVTELEASVEEQKTLKSEAMEKVTELEASVEEQRALKYEALEKVTVLEACVEEQIVLKSKAMEKVTVLEASVEEQIVLKSEAMEKVTVLEASVEEQIVLKSEAMEKVTELEASVEEQKALKSEAIEKVTESEASVEEQRALKSEAMEKVTELEASVEEQRALKSEAELAIADLKQTLEEQISLQSELEQKLTEKVCEVEGCQARINELEAGEGTRIQGLESAMEEAQSEKQTMIDELEEVRKEVSDLKKTITDLEAKLNGEKVDKVIVREALESQIEELEDEIKCLKGTEGLRTVEVSELTAGLNERSEKVAVLAQKVQELEVKERKLETTNLSLESARSVMEEKVKEIQDEVDGERSRRQEAERERAVMAAMMTGLESTLETAEAHEEDVNRALETISALKQDLKEANTYITEQNSRLDSLEVKFNSRENDFAKKDASLQEMSERLKHDDELSCRVKELEERLATADKAAATFQTQIETLRGLAAEQDAERSDQDKAVEEFEAEKNELEKQLEKISKENVKLVVDTAAEIKALKQLLSDKEEEVDQLQTRLDTFVMTPRQTRRGRSSKAPTSLTATTEENYLQELKNLSDQLEKEKERRKVENERYNKDMSAKDQIIGDLKESNLQLTSMLPNTPAKEKPRFKCEPISMQRGGLENIDPATSGIDLSTLDIPMESFSGQVNIPSLSPEPVKRKARGRPKKKASDQSTDSFEPTPTRSGRKSRRKQISSGQRGSTSSSVSPNLSSMEFQYQPAPVMQKRKRRLYKDMDPLLEGCSPAKMTSHDQRLLFSGCHCDCHREMLASPCTRRCCKRCTYKPEEDDATILTATRRRLRTITTPRH